MPGGKIRIRNAFEGAKIEILLSADVLDALIEHRVAEIDFSSSDHVLELDTEMWVQRTNESNDGEPANLAKLRIEVANGDLPRWSDLDDD